MIKDDIDELESSITVKSRSSTYTTAIKDADEIRLKNIKSFAVKVEDFTVEEITAFTRLKSVELKTYHLIELLKLRKTNTAIEAVLKTDSPNLAEIVKTLKSEKAAGKVITQELIDSLELIRVKPLMKVAGAVVDFVKSILKFAARVLKF